MQYRVEQLASAAGVRVDTVRYYQSRGLIAKPRREGRVAIYDDAHLARLRQIRGLLEQGFTLAQIHRVIELPDPAAKPEPLLEALVQERGDGRTFSRAELAAEAGIPEALIQAAQAADLVEPMDVDGESRFSRSDLEMARAALAILGAGLPLDELLQLSVSHARNVRSLADGAIDLFDDYVRKTGVDDATITDVFERLLPQATRLVALHFQRTLVNRALERLRGKADGRALELALATVRAGRLEVEWR